MPAHTSAERICQSVRAQLPNIRQGTLRMWGQWFGRPHDNIHWIVACDSEGDALRVHFNEGEVLTLWRPENATISADKFSIERASRVRWEWYYYGRPKTAENIYYIDYMFNGLELKADTNVTWYALSLTSDRGPAAELI